MRFPLSLTTSMVGYMARKKLTGVKRFPLVLMLEPLHACNLTCTGCGRIREYSQTIKEKLSVEELLCAVAYGVVSSISSSASFASITYCRAGNCQYGTTVAPICAAGSDFPQKS